MESLKHHSIRPLADDRPIRELQLSTHYPDEEPFNKVNTGRRERCTDVYWLCHNMQ
ncbi:hypothetical protein SK128_027377, partial [Halocaridina rubra]